MPFIYYAMGIFAAILGVAASSLFSKNTAIINLVAMLAIVCVMALTKIIIMPYYQELTFAYALENSDPQFKSIVARFPNEYREFVTSAKKTLGTENSERVLPIYQLGFLNKISKKVVLIATNKSLYDYYQVELAVDKVLYSVDPHLVLYLEYPKKFIGTHIQSNIVLLLTQNLMQDLISKKEAIILSAIQTPTPPMSYSKRIIAFSLVKHILEQLATAVGSQNKLLVMINAPESPLVDKNSAALLIILFYEKILATGEDNAGIIFKYLALLQS